MPDRPTPMTLANMRHNGVRAVIATCRVCRHSADVVVDPLHDDVLVPEVGLWMVCARCGARGPETRPAWHTVERKEMAVPAPFQV